MADKESRTEEATHKKLTEARGEGNIPMSREATNFAYLLAALLVISVLGRIFLVHLADLLTGLLGNVGQIRIETGEDLSMIFNVVCVSAALITAPIVLAFTAAGVLASALQTTPSLKFNRIMPDFSRISLAKGFGRLFSMSGTFEFLKLTLRLAIITAASISILMYLWHDFTNSIWSDPAGILLLSQKSLTMLLSVLAVLSCALLVFDLPVTHILWRRSLRMAPEEVKDERKQMEGDPHIKSRQRSIGRARIRQRMLTSVPRATLVIANPTHFAVALRYVRSEGGAPKVVAKGQDLVALTIRRIAEENDIPVVEDKALARSLYAKVEVDQMIPVEFYKAVAQVLLRLQARRNGPQPIRA
ncbi:flagellar biosynthesis protein FlhB [Hyphomicrobium sp.]|uniref:EscU/YscU/HrcU family type III secretion system export apparatus switch protein n=1 Tax=Hyphomicrobium sp. TaxID=82 RepID=UPI0025B94D53|nr:flagellar type III secretion system protein FlhB [Hyphomicrobium sp.]